MKMNIITGIIALLLSASIAIAAQLPDFPFLYDVGVANNEKLGLIWQQSLDVDALDQNPVKDFDMVQNRRYRAYRLVEKAENSS